MSTMMERLAKAKAKSATGAPSPTLTQRMAEEVAVQAERRAERARREAEHEELRRDRASGEAEAIIAAGHARAAEIRGAANEELVKARVEADKIIAEAMKLRDEAKNARKIAIQDFVTSMSKPAKRGITDLAGELKRQVDDYFAQYGE
jgi:hypothetical protein